MKSSPLAQVKQRFNDKAGLIAAIKALATADLWQAKGDTSVDAALAHTPNKKLLRLHETLSSVKKEHGSRAGLISAILKAGKREKDGDYKKKLETLSTPRLADLCASAKKSASN